jgi:predicted amidohydrolase
MSRVARQLGVHVVFPFYEKGEAPGVVYHSSARIDSEGKVLDLYRKTHLIPTERNTAGGWSTPGDQAKVVETRLETIGMIICYDGTSPNCPGSARSTVRK